MYIHPVAPCRSDFAGDIMRPRPEPSWDPDDPPYEPRCALDGHERSMLSQAAAELDDARGTDLTRLDGPGLIRLVERLRSALDDTVQLLRDLQA